MSVPARDCLALAADLPLPKAEALYAKVQPHIGVVKVGLSLFVEHGPFAVETFTDQGARVFLDLKLHDIPNTVELAAAHAASLGVAFLTVHAQGGVQMLKAALKGAKDGAAQAKVAPPRILAVTVLTSLDDAELQAQGVASPAAEQAVRLARHAQSAGINGFVCSAQEVAAMRQALGPQAFLCTPGIRPVGADQADQARVETPGAALRQGANLLVVGRPIHQASDPVVAARSLERELDAAQAFDPKR